MAVYDLKDQEEIENFKHFWRSWGRWLFAVLAAAALAYLGWVVYQSYQNGKNSEAVALFDDWAQKYQAGQHGQSAEVLVKLQSEYPATVSAAQATLMQAGYAYGQARYDEAAGHLNWVLKYQDEPLIRALAIQRLATVQLQQQQYDAALATLAQPVDAAFEAQILETKGDVYLAQGKPEEAVAAYRQALEKLPEISPARELLKLKAEQAI